MFTTRHEEIDRPGEAGSFRAQRSIIMSIHILMSHIDPTRILADEFEGHRI